MKIFIYYYCVVKICWINQPSKRSNYQNWNFCVVKTWNITSKFVVVFGTKSVFQDGLWEVREETWSCDHSRPLEVRGEEHRGVGRQKSWWKQGADCQEGSLQPVHRQILRMQVSICCLMTLFLYLRWIGTALLYCTVRQIFFRHSAQKAIMLRLPEIIFGKKLMAASVDST